MVHYQSCDTCSMFVQGLLETKTIRPRGQLDSVWCMHENLLLEVSIEKRRRGVNGVQMPGLVVRDSKEDANADQRDSGGIRL